MGAVESDFQKKSQFMIDNHLPIWVGEFSPLRRTRLEAILSGKEH